ncbi:hypothetical protein ACFVJ5_06990 [Nocardia sp. NPDC127606]|uniref:hypothetical protein n=1 Tax=Nocardia sp. NPDC127606 TaxID=3345406 RepID=UPI0036384298
MSTDRKMNPGTDSGKTRPSKAAEPSAERSPRGFADEFVGEIDDDLVERVSPDPWTLSWALLGTRRHRENLTNLFADQRTTMDWFADERAHLRQHRPG